MKNLFFGLFLLTMSFTIVNAKVITVNNNSNGLAQYTSLTAAYDSASVGDTLYIHGSPTSYGDITISKKVVLIGAGYNVKGTAYNYESTLRYVTIDSTNFTPLSGTRLIGLVMSTINGDGTQKGSKIYVERCRLTSSTNIYGPWVLKNNIFSSYVYVNSSDNVLIANNIFVGSGYINSSDKNTVLIINNDFLGVSYGGLSSVTNALIANNIFYDSPAMNSSVNTNIFNNNLTYHTTTPDIPMPPTAGTNTGVGNLANTNPLLKNAVSSYSTNVYTNEYDLLNGSPAIDAGTDGTDLGIYGGSYPMPNLTGHPAIPQVNMFDIKNSVVPKDSTLTFTVKAKKID